MTAAADWAARALGHRFADADLVTAALTHRSARGSHNERLEFLGDAVLSLGVAGLLFREFGAAAEGDLSRYRAALVSGEALADVAESLGVGEHLRLGPGELKSGGFRRRSILADALEALIGAVYLDAGFEAARALVERLVRPRLDSLPAALALKDAKTRLQEWLQGRGLPLPRYAVLDVRGEPHDQLFTVRCEIEAVGGPFEGRGPSRRRAEQEAAEAALERLITNPAAVAESKEAPPPVAGEGVRSSGGGTR
ncbi:MAG: ribonuclease III [Steroidobacteraceae bacterium]|nr:ribonuclease III [Steroidobacteraceae bacterium]